MFSGRINGFGLRNALALVALLASAALVFTHSADADPPFAPTVSIETSTTRAAAHPDARITIDNTASSEDIENISMDLPDGMLGSLNAAEQCTVAEATATACPADSQIGTVVNFARVDNSEAVLRGKVYLTESLPLDAGKIDLDTGSTNTEDPASLQIVVPAKIGGVDMGTVVVNARVQMHYADRNPDWTFGPTGAAGSIRGVRTIVNSVPRDIEDEHGRIVAFDLEKLVVDLRSDQVSPHTKLLTNSSRCRTTQIAIEATSYAASEASDVDDYTTTQCGDVHVGDIESASFTPGSTSAGSAFTFTSSIEFPDDQPATNSMKLQMPPMIATNPPGLGEPQQQCPVNNIDYGQIGDANNFTTIGCPPEAKVGTVEIETPLLPDPVIGELYLVEASPIPHIGIYVDPDTGPNNPAGVTFGVAGISSVEKLVPACSGTCREAITVQFDALPDVPLKKVTVIGDPATRTGTTGADRTGNILALASAGDTNCQPNGDVSIRSSSWTTYDEENMIPGSGGSGIATFATSGCNARNATLTGSPYGGFASSATPSLAYADATAATAGCGVDKEASLSVCDPIGGIGGGNSFTPSSLDAGIHHFYTRVARVGGQFNWRTFAVPVDPPSDTIAPEVTLGTVPSDPTSDTTPSVDFTSDEDAYFQCSLDNGPFLPCDSAVTDPASSGSYTVPNALIPNDTEHSIRIRAQDAAGNTSSIESTTFKVEVVLDPTFDVFKPGTETPGLSTEVARAHPEMDIRVTSGSHEDIKNLQLKMPRGLLGGLTAVPTICPLADAQDALCTDDSMVGTVDTEAVVDESTVRISGKVYMTTPIVLGDPAGLMVDVHAKIQDIDDGHVLVPIRLAVAGPRVGNAVTDIQGIESFATDIPQKINPATAPGSDGFDSESEFDLRSMTLKLRNNPSASQPLLTNPSECTPDNFEVSFEGYDGTDVAKSTPNIDWTGCGALGFGTSVSMSMVDIETGQPPVESSNSYVPKTTFTTDLAMDPNGSSIKNATVLLPKNVTVNVGELPAPCPVDTYQTGGAEACPASTIMGSVSATSPLLREPLNGKVYILKSNDKLPRLILALRGPIDTDIIGDMTIVNITQIRTTFASSPDAPISALHLVVNRIVRTRNEACSYGPDETNAISTFNAYNGKSATNANALPVTCIGSGSAKFSYKKGTKKQKNRSTLSVSLRAPTGTQYKSVQVEFPKGISMVKSGFKKGLKIKSGSSKLKYSCGKAKKSNRFTSALCNKPNKDIALSWGAGSIKAKKLKKPTFKITAVDSLGRTHVFSVRSSK